MQTIYLTAYDSKLIGKLDSRESLYMVFCDCSLNAFTVNLPRFNEMAGKELIFKKDSSANALTISANGEYIETAQTVSISADESVTIIPDTSKYRIIEYPSLTIIEYPSLTIIDTSTVDMNISGQQISAETIG